MGPGQDDGSTRRRRIGAALVLAAAVVVAIVAPGGAQGAVGASKADVAACPASDAMPVASVSDERSERALLCLVNRERARAGMRPLRANRCLARAADAHARDMVREHYFEHDSRDGTGFAERILATGYAPPDARWTVGENLAWGSAPAGDAAWVMDAWMNSRDHRANLLRASFRDVGLAAVAGAPVDADGPRATWAADFGIHDGGRGRCG
ncbi:CAP domain-containing protein [Conexibacter sp. JD483]|uniref:CAP domain-containing protein n=1 Tax=unclassified Conexibacter TaxID=2627773 RepID=UPI00271789CB|nr:MULTISPECIES: CAP domain-containing protein [unclassified Conexibacter]MDO8184325.1 CAP domain-containing protein [Conexibacter sp. CPCC 205706]MDO8197631.1 CAP domain-containing protein [Conexibacter sp. CPCC 205762]MDR9372865.1 CAP domain-containing protein [Conexibacter sp. JD483]